MKPYFFVGCEIAILLWNQVARWLEMDIPTFSNVTSIFTWIDQISTYRKRREVVDTVCCTFLWILWNYGNAILFSDTIPKRSVLFDSVVDYSFDWFHNRNSKNLISRNSWILNPML